eukprot:g12794.t1
MARDLSKGLPNSSSEAELRPSLGISRGQQLQNATTSLLRPLAVAAAAGATAGIGRGRGRSRVFQSAERSSATDSDEDFDYGAGKAYWDKRYQNEVGNTYDWLGGYEKFSEFIESATKDLSEPTSARILDLGCGNARLAEEKFRSWQIVRIWMNSLCGRVWTPLIPHCQPRQDMYDRGFYNITGLDISDVAIESMRQRNAEERPKIHWVVGDAFELPFEDTVCQKLGVTVLVYRLLRTKMYSEAQRVLKKGGTLLVFSAAKQVPRTGLRLPHLSFELEEKDSLWAFVAIKTDRPAMPLSQALQMAQGADLQMLQARKREEEAEERLKSTSSFGSCPAGKHLGVQLKDLQPELQCISCPSGKFSLGGGLLISGVAGDWHQSWPVGLRSSCSYQLSDGTLQTRKGSTTGLSGACELRVLAPESVSGTYLIRRMIPSSKRPVRPVARIILAPGDRRLCTQPRRSDLGVRRLQFSGQRPGQGTKEQPMYQRFWLLAAIGGCTTKQKSQNAAAVGADGVLLASAASLAIGSGYFSLPPSTSGGRAHNATAPSFLMLEDRDSQLLASGLRTLSETILVNNTALHACAKMPTAPPRRPGLEGSEYGCEPWTPDELGLSIHSGENRAYSRLVSTLELATNIEGYDGLRLEVDWTEVMPLVSQQLTWKELRVNLTRGAHFLRWQYDYSDASGTDRAQLQLVQVVGTAFADLECFHCHGSGTHSAGGAEHCNATGQNIPPHILGGTSGGRSWLQPIRCDVNASGAHALLASGKIMPCTTCEPNTERAFSGSGECLPKRLPCITNLKHYAVTQLSLSRWEEWPKNLSQKVVTTFGEVEGNASIPGGWRLWPDNSPGIGIDIGVTGELESRLNLMVMMLMSPGKVAFTLEISGGCQWGTDVQFLVDNVEAAHLSGLNVTRTSMAGQWRRLQVEVPLWPGEHRLTWRSAHPVLATNIEHVRLKSVNVTGARGGGDIRCQSCPNGTQVGADKRSCERTYSLSGATECKLLGILKTTEPTAAKVDNPQEVVMNATAAVAHWNQVTKGVSGPFLVAGRQFLINLIRPIESEDGRAFASVTPSSPSLAIPVGMQLTKVEAVAEGNVRGVRFRWTKEFQPIFENKSLVKPKVVACGAEGRPEDRALQVATLLLRCDPTARDLAPEARMDPRGIVHLDDLRLAGGGTIFNQMLGCNRVDLEWSTLMACPACQAQDFAAQRTECDQNGYRLVSYKLMRPCIGGFRAPPGYEAGFVASVVPESCDGKDVRSVVKGVEETVKQKYPVRAVVFAIATILLGCLLVCYASHLHRSHRTEAPLWSAKAATRG